MQLQKSIVYLIIENSTVESTVFLVKVNREIVKVDLWTEKNVKTI